MDGTTTSPITGTCGIRKDPHFTVSVHFASIVSTKEELQERISKMPNPQIITWFMGHKGLKEDWLYDLSDKMATIRKIDSLSHFYLYDLRNWKLMRDKDADKAKETSSIIKEKVQQLDIADVTYLDSAGFFSFLQKSHEKEFTSYVNNTLWKREFIWVKSESFTPRGITISETLDDLPLLHEIKNRDISYAYSGLQYIEAYYLIEEILRKEALSDEVSIVFLLPNDEDVYYRDDMRSFEKDIRELLIKQKDVDPYKNVQVTILPFKWGKSLEERPYLSEGKEITEDNLDLLNTLVV